MSFPPRNLFSNEFMKMHDLKNLIAKNEANGHGWPNVVLNVQTETNYRPDVKGPLSLFMNLKGATHCEIGNHRVRVDDSNYFLTNSQDIYTLDIGGQGKIETFNIHFGDEFAQSILKGYNHSRLSDIDTPDKEIHTPEFFSHLHQRDEKLNQLIMGLYHDQGKIKNNQLLLEEHLAGILAHLIEHHKLELQTLDTLSSEKYSTREEIYTRINIAKDYIHSHFEENITLEQLAQVACMSRFHFLRSFKEVVGLSPHQYVLKLQIEKAQQMLKFTKEVSEVAVKIGFNDLSSFSRAFKKHVGVAPSKYLAI